MEGELRGRSQERGATAADTLFALRQLEGLGAAAPVVLAYHPVARTNPYQSLLYRRCWEHGIAPVPLASLDWLDDLVGLVKMGPQVALHLHWTKGILAGAETPADAARRRQAFLGRLDGFLAAGGKLVWTVHNILPHDSRFPDEDARLQQAIADRAAVVHILAAATDRAVAGSFSIDQAKVLEVPHPSYRGAYADVVTREEARYQLGLDPDEMVYGVFGAIRPYKGLTDLLDAFDLALERPGRRRLLVAGAPSGLPGEEVVLDRCALHPFVVLFPRRIPSDEMQLYLRAADVAVIPYQRTLNSGVLMLALTFGLPVVVPKGSALEGIVNATVARTFEPGHTGSLAESLIAAEDLRTSASRAAATDIAERYDPDRLADAFARGISERLRSPIPADGHASVRSRTTVTKV
jgi:beta-1,4-mannosyltransferase